MNIGIFGDRRSRLPAEWTKETVVTLVGDTDVDGSAGAGPDASLTVVFGFGDTTVRVPSGARVTTGGFGLLGDRKVEVSGSGGPEIRVAAYGLFGDVTVTDQPG